MSACSEERHSFTRLRILVWLNNISKVVVKGEGDTLLENSVGDVLLYACGT